MGWDGSLGFEKCSGGKWISIGEAYICDIVTSRRGLAVALGSEDVGVHEEPHMPIELDFLVSNGSKDWDSQSGYLDWNLFRTYTQDEMFFPFLEYVEIIERMEKINPRLALMLRSSEDAIRCSIDIAW